ncbi:MAG: hypothetical protein JSR91_01855 [Proteobacteria bacterium]|nr:hypothetical protein [Pseudomonadota bacterium]
MSNPTDTFPSDLDVNRLLALLNGIVPSMPPSSPRPPPSPSWSDYVRAQYGADPSLFAMPASDTPGFHKSPAVLDSLAAADPRPPGFYRSPALLAASTTAQGFDPSPIPTIGPQEMLFGGPCLPADTNVPLPSNLPSLAQSMARLSTPPGFYKSPALMGSGTPTPSLDPSLVSPGMFDSSRQQYATVAQSCRAGLDACMAVGRPRIDCIRAYHKCSTLGVPMIFAPGFWGKQT